MKIGIITFHAAHNFGSMLQAYALQEYLKKEGQEVSIINFQPASQKALYSSIFNITHLRNIRDLILRILFSPKSIIFICKKRLQFKRFLSKYLNLTTEFNNIKELKKANFNFDIIITGSDQIWNIEAADFSEAYFGSFISSSATKKIAYAPSMGPNPEKLNQKYLHELLKNYTAISVREERAKIFLEKNRLASNVQIVLDPTMLLSANDYSQIIPSDPIVKGNYIYYYTPGPKPRHEFLQIAEKISQDTGLPIICDTPYLFAKQYNLTYQPAVGPCEFLNLIKHATIVCGASFHLMVFSIIFQKDFYCINGDIDSRMNNLMKLFNLEERILSTNDTTNFKFKHISKYDDVESRLVKMRESSRKFIIQNCNNNDVK